MDEEMDEEMDEHEPSGRASGVDLLGKHAFFGRLDAQLAAEGHAVSPPQPAVSASAPGTPSARPAVVQALPVFTSTAPAELTAAVLALKGRMPFVPPPPEPPATGKHPAKTVQSRAVPSRVGGQTMALDVAQSRPTPTLPFAGSAEGVGYVPPLDARQYVALTTELTLEPAPREETLCRYHVPTEAALRSLQEQWQHPAQRAALEGALADFTVMLRGRLLRSG